MAGFAEPQHGYKSVELEQNKGPYEYRIITRSTSKLHNENKF